MTQIKMILGYFLLPDQKTVTPQNHNRKLQAHHLKTSPHAKSNPPYTPVNAEQT